MKRSDIAMIGMAVMGENLSLNMERNGFAVTVFDVREGIVDRFVEGRGKGKNFFAAHSYRELVDSLEKPRRVMMMIRAGSPVDEVMAELMPLLEEGDVIIDGGNSHFMDTRRRAALAESRGLRYVGTGVSGGETGALNGPSLMPGGSEGAWAIIEPVFTKICAKTDGDACCRWVGSDGAGHYVKMVHNGIEYGDMQLICEAYQLLRDGLGMDNDEIASTFAAWNRTELDSYLIGITADILAHKESDGTHTVDMILDRAGQKGTGKWASVSAFDEGIPLTLISEAVFARCLSALKDERVAAEKLYPHAYPKFEGDREAFIEDVRCALLAGKIVSYTQGFMLLDAARREYGWHMDFGDIALMWRGGCIIRSTFLGRIRDAFAENAECGSLLMNGYFRDRMLAIVPSLRRVASHALQTGIPAAALCAALTWFDAYTTGRLPANLLQAQRDYFGAHTYERTDAPRGKMFHTDWTGTGGSTTSTSYTT